MVAYLSEHDGYVPMNRWNGGFMLAWNIKVYRMDYSGKSGDPVEARFDVAWQEYVEAHDSLFWQACQSATEMYTAGEWTNYPGIEQGGWKFGINGRSGEWMILTEAPSWCPAPRAWRMFPMIWESRASYCEWLAGLDVVTLKRFYRAIRVLDHDLRREACEQEVAYHLSFARTLWEESKVAEENASNAELEKSRLDMYG